MSRARDQEDADLLRLAAAGDEEAFSTFFRRRYQSVYRFALHMSGSPATAEEVTQEVFMALVREPASYDPTRGSIAAFLYGVARNHVLRIQKKERRFLELPDADEQTGFALDNADPGVDLIRAEGVSRVRRAIAALPSSYREVVALCELEEMSYVEAAEVLGCPVGTVRSRLHRARRLLREALRKTAGGVNAM
jgi:RNA polymerase sigma-70 factor (ECF subfamily)